MRFKISGVDSTGRDRTIILTAASEKDALAKAKINGIFPDIVTVSGDDEKEPPPKPIEPQPQDHPKELTKGTREFRGRYIYKMVQIPPTISVKLHFPRKPIGEQAPLTKSRHLTCVAGNYLSPGPSGRRRGNYSSELSGRSELPFGRRQTVQRAGGLPRRSSPGPAGPLTCRRRNGAHDALPSCRRFCVFWESAA